MVEVRGWYCVLVVNCHICRASKELIKRHLVHDNCFIAFVISSLSLFRSSHRLLQRVYACYAFAQASRTRGLFAGTFELLRPYRLISLCVTIWFQIRAVLHSLQAALRLTCLSSVLAGAVVAVSTAMPMLVYE